MTTIKQILKAIACPHLELVRAPEGYHYFIYDDTSTNIYETLTVPCYRLNHQSLDYWVADGEEFVAKCEKIAAETAENDRLTMIKGVSY